MNTILLKLRDHKYYSRKYREQIIRWIVWKLPRSVVMWAFYRVLAHATTGKYGKTIVNEITAIDAIKRWDKDNGER